MRTFDDLLEHELGEEVQLINAPRQNPRNCFETGTKGKIIEFFENGLMIETDKGEQIRVYLPVCICKCKSKRIIKEDIEAGNSPFDADEVFHKEMKAYTDETIGKSVLEMVGGEKHINPHYDIKAESTSCYPIGENFTGIDINGVRFSNFGEMLRYMDRQREQLDKAKSLLAKWVELYKPKLDDFQKPPIQVDTEQFLKDSEVEK